MSKNIAIKEGDTGKQFRGVEKIKIKNIEGGTSYWIPESLGTKNITEDGTYKASEEVDEGGVNRGWYGYSQVTVSGIGKVVATDPSDGNEHMWDKDPDTDELRDNGAVPSSIGFAQLPAKLVYQDGENITLVGAVVRGALKDGTPWEGDEGHPNGIIPLTELTLEPSIATAEGIGQRKKYIDGIGEVYYSHKTKWSYKNSNRSYIDRDIAITTDNNDFLVHSTALLYVFSKTPGVTSRTFHKWTKDEWAEKIDSPFVNELVGSYRYNGNTVTYYYATCGHTYEASGSNIEWVEFDLPRTDVLSFQNIALVLFEGDDLGGTKEIKVKWNRPNDNKELQTTFEIVVQPISVNDGDS